MPVNDSRTEERLIRIESALAHLQHDIEELNTSLTRHFHRLQNFEDRFVRIEHQIVTLSEDPESRDAADEKPPHY